MLEENDNISMMNDQIGFYRTEIIKLMESYGLQDFLISDRYNSDVKGWASNRFAIYLQIKHSEKVGSLWSNPFPYPDYLECVQLINLLSKTDDVILSHSSRKDIMATLSNKELKYVIWRLLHTWLEYRQGGLFQWLFDIDFKQTDEFICDFTKPYTDGELKMIEDYCKNAIHNKDKFTKKGGEYGKIADYIANLMMNNETYSKLGVTKQYCFVYDAMSIAEIVDHEGLSNKDKYNKVKFWLEQYEKDKNK